MGGERCLFLQQWNDKLIEEGVRLRKQSKGLNVGKASGMDGIVLELVKKRGKVMILSLERMLGACLDESIAPRDFRDMCMFPC